MESHVSVQSRVRNLSARFIPDPAETYPSTIVQRS